MNKIIDFIRKINSPFPDNYIYSLSNKVVLLSSGVTCLFIGILWRSLPPKIPIWFSKPWGVDQLDHPAWLFILPFGSILIHLLNVITSLYFLKNHITFTNILLTGSIFINLISLIITVNILYLVV